MNNVISLPDLLHDIANLAYVIADVSEGKETPHTLHQTYDICESGNLCRVESLLTLAIAEVAAALGEIGSMRCRGDKIVLTTKGVTKSDAAKIAALAREYLTASILHGWLAVTLPAAADFWSERKTETLDSLTATIFAATLPLRAFPRRLPPL